MLKRSLPTPDFQHQFISESLGSSHYSKRNTAVNILLLNISVGNNNSRITSRCLLEYVQSTSTRFSQFLLWNGFLFCFKQIKMTRITTFFVKKTLNSHNYFLIKEESVSIKININENQKVGREPLPPEATCSVLGQHTAACCSHAASTALTSLHGTRQAMAVPTCSDTCPGSSHGKKEDGEKHKTNK